MSLSVYVTPDRSHVFYHAPTQKYLTIGSNTISVSEKTPLNHTPTTPVSCILGVIKLKFQKYIVVADSHEVTAVIMGHQIAKVKLFSIRPLGDSTVSQKNAEEAQYLKLMHQHLSNATLFFSVDNTYDLTNSLQRQLSPGAGATAPRDPRFWWNYYLCSELISASSAAPAITPFITPVIYGYAKSHTATFRGSLTLDFALITRRSRLRAGTRYFRRGVDQDGSVANFNETEQILATSDNNVYSFLQTRGSVPVYWTEINNLKYKPNLVVSPRPSLDATAKHFAEQVSLYKENYLVNLVNQSGYEKPVKDAYEKAVQTLPEKISSHVKYIYFDFHHECRKMRWDRVRLLIDHLCELGYSSDNYFQYDVASGKVKSEQTKVVRTNCMDCLDRTNVVQSMLARWVLQDQLQKSNYLDASLNTPWEVADPHFNLFFQSFWADNADRVSCAYSGTGALKTDYTRTGKRTKMGAFKDLTNSITRYYLNNYRDGHRQDSYDLFLGNYRPYQDSLINPFVDRRLQYTQMVPYLLGASVFILATMLAFPKGPVTSWKNIFLVSGCLLVGFHNFNFMLKNGYQFVDWPHLAPLDFLQTVDVVDGKGKILGVRYEERDSFKTSKKRN